MQLNKMLMTVVLLVMSSLCLAADEVVTPDLHDVVESFEWGLLNRDANIIEQDDRVIVQFDGRPGMGGACFQTMDFANGIIECDIKGQPQRPSFVGIAWDVTDTKTYDAVYFRPFNFRTEGRQQHSVQYISHPEHTWYKLRQEFPGIYEAAIEPAPDPNEFFHVKLVIKRPQVSVYVNDSAEPCLVVEHQLNQVNVGKIALFVDNESEGMFSNLKITHQAGQ